MIERRIKAAKFPATKSLDSFDFKAIPSLNKALTMELGSLRVRPSPGESSSPWDRAASCKMRIPRHVATCSTRMWPVIP